jgi:SAM-dependent methyltransferase
MSTSEMRSNWDRRAASDLVYFTLTTYGRGFNDLERFFREGTFDGITLLRPILSRLAFDPRGKHILDIGSGCGRLFGGYEALGFAEITGIDVSAEMVRKGEELCPVPGARFVLGSGRDLEDIETGSVDFCFSYNVLGHVPSRDILWCYLKEVRRVLKPGGAFQLHFRSHYPLRRRMVAALPDSARQQLRDLYWRVTGRRDEDERRTWDPTDGTWLGRTVPHGQMRRWLAELGFVDTRLLTDPSYGSGELYFAVGRRAPSLGRVP